MPFRTLVFACLLTALSTTVAAETSIASTDVADVTRAIFNKSTNQPNTLLNFNISRHREIVKAGPTAAEEASIPPGLARSTCVAATLYTVLPTASRPSYKKWVNDLVVNEYLSDKGVNQKALIHLLKGFGYETTDLSVGWGQENSANLDQAADALDAGHLVLLVTDAGAVFRAQGGVIHSESLRKSLQWGSLHLVRLTAVARNKFGTPTAFGIYDANYAGGAVISKEKLENEVLQLKAIYKRPRVWTKRSIIIAAAPAR